MQSDFQGVSPSDFVQNFHSQISPDEALLELARRMSLASQKTKNCKASEEAVGKLPIIEIEEKHCKRIEAGGGEKMEPPTCAICVELI